MVWRREEYLAHCRGQAKQREAGGLAYLGLRGAFDEPRELLGLSQPKEKRFGRMAF